MNKVEKLLRLALRPSLWRPLALGTAAGLEHDGALRRLNVKTCIDIGANRGQFSVLCQSLFPGVKIFAFEPLPEVAARLSRAIGSVKTKIFVHALGSTETQSNFFVTERSDSSSLLKPGAPQERAYGSKVATKTSVEVRRLDHVLAADEIVRPALMKLDVQGGELDVLKGCGDLLDSIDVIYLEGSFVELYEGQALITDIILFLSERGFVFRSIHNTSYTEEFGATQADFLFTRAKTAKMGALVSAHATPGDSLRGAALATV